MSERRRPSAFEHRANAVLGALLLVVIAVLGNRIARDHLALRRDLSEDQLYSLSPGARRILQSLDDVLQVEAFVTGEARHAAAQLARGRLLERLREFQVAADGRLEVRLRDPNASSEARLDAARLGITPLPLSGYQGTAAVTQNVYLGLVLRYAGREQVLPFVLPWDLEYSFARAVRRLTRERELVVGFVGGSGDGRADGFASARDVLEVQHRVVPVTGLAAGAPVPAGVDVLVVARPMGLHPRAAFAVDQYLQRGGRALLALDRTIVDASRGRVGAIPGGAAGPDGTTGLEPLLASWGLVLSEGQVFDLACNVWSVVRQVESGGRATRVRDRIEYPYWPRIERAGLAREHAATAELSNADLFWAHPLLEREPVPGVERTLLIESSDRAWVVPPVAALALDGEALNAQAAELLARGDAGRRTLAVALVGRLPSPFAGGAPAPYDPLDDEPGRTTDEPVASAAEEAHVIVVGDADWITDGNTFTEDNRRLLENAIDWMGLERDLMEIRARLPRDRAIVDFVDEERRERNIATLDGSLSWAEAERATRLETEAQRAAGRRRWLAMGAAVAGSLLGYALLAGAVALARRRFGPGERA